MCGVLDLHENWCMQNPCGKKPAVDKDPGVIGVQSGSSPCVGHFVLAAVMGAAWCCLVYHMNNVLEKDMDRSEERRRSQPGYEALVNHSSLGGLFRTCRQIGARRPLLRFVLLGSWRHPDRRCVRRTRARKVICIPKLFRRRHTQTDRRRLEFFQSGHPQKIIQFSVCPTHAPSFLLTTH